MSNPERWKRIVDLHESLEGLGGFRNLLIHDYLELDQAEVHRFLGKALDVFPRFAREVLAWMEDATARNDG